MDSAPAHPRRRGLREWVVDTSLFLLAVGLGVWTSAERLSSAPLPVPEWLFDLDQVVGVLGCAGLWLRRRWPVELAVVLVVLSAFFELIAGAMLAALFTVAVHRPPRTTGAVFGLSVLAAIVFTVLRPEPAVSNVLLLTFGLTLQSTAVGWGLFVQHRRRLKRLRVEQVQLQTREEIAREIHDVLGHRLSLLSVHAGALEYRPDAPPEDIARAAGVIRENAHQALQDLREVIGVLRAPVGELPQPTLADLRQLVAESRRAGMRLDLSEETAGSVPDQVGRTAYRIVQEALTNARKHAPGADVCVRVAGERGRGLTVDVTNGPSTLTPARHGLGLIGLTERITLAGGTLEHGPVPGGGWRVSAWLPWPS